jgi:bilin biosynthesis protein
MGVFNFFSRDKPEAQKEIHELINELRSEMDKKTRKNAAEELLKRGETSVYPLIGALSDKDWRVREESAKALGTIGDPRAVPHLILLFKDPKTRVQLWATDALIKMREVSTRPLIQALNESDHRIRMGSIVALGEIHDVEAVSALSRLLDDENKEIASAAKEAIETIESGNA